MYKYLTAHRTSQFSHRPNTGPIFLTCSVHAFAKNSCMTEKSFPNVFVTVGTTRFDKLLSRIDTADIQETLVDRFGTRKLVIQVGNSEVEPKCTNNIYMTLQEYT